MRTIKENLGGIATFLFELIVGIVLLVDPTGFTSAIITLAGAVLILYGLISAIRYFRTEPVYAMKFQMLSKGLAGILAGIFCISYCGYLLNLILPILTTAYGAVILITGLTKVQWTVDIIRMKKKKWFLAAISALLSVLCGLIVIFNPFATVQVLWMFIGISLIVEAAFDVLSLIFGINKKDKPEPICPEPEETPAEE